MSDSYQTLSGKTEAELRDRGSRFLGFVFPVANAAEARTVLAEMRRGHPKANHHCLAYRLGEDFRASDDGEPSGSAGRPMLAAIDSAGLDCTAAIVVRYFGGTLLGVPGLIHAYRTVIAEAITKAEKVTKYLEHRFEIGCDYATIGDVLRILRMQDATILHQDMQLFCTVVAGIRPANEARFLEAMTDICSATVKKL